MLARAITKGYIFQDRGSLRPVREVRRRRRLRPEGLRPSRLQDPEQHLVPLLRAEAPRLRARHQG